VGKLKESKAWIAFLGLVILAGLVAWGFQLKEGMILTNMRNPFSWGIYIATFAFFVGIAAGGLIVSSSVYIFDLAVLKPLARIAKITAFASTMGAAAMVLPDLGRADRVYNLLLHPNFRSPLVWDIIVITGYALVTLVSLYIDVLPDLSRKNSRLAFPAGGKTEDEVLEISRRLSRVVAYVGLPFAILIHTVTAWIFSTQVSRSWWNTAVLPPDFISVAIASGTALVILVSLMVKGRETFPQYAGAYRTLASISGGFIIVHFFLMYNDFMLRWWWGAAHEMEPLLIALRDYTWLHLAEVVLPFAAMLMFLHPRTKSSVRGLYAASLILLAGVYAHRFLLMPSSYNSMPLSLPVPGASGELWAYPIATGVYDPPRDIFVSLWNYVPSGVEVMITLFPVALVLMVITLGVRYLPGCYERDAKVSLKRPEKTISC